MTTRLGFMGRLKPECVEKYLALHAAPWPTVLERIRECKLANYSIFHRRLGSGEHWVFTYLEYVGDDFEADMARMAADPETQRWWDECKPCFEQCEPLPPGEVWVPMDQVFFQE